MTHSYHTHIKAASEAMSRLIQISQLYTAFKSCLNDRIYQMSAHERHHNASITSEELWIFFES